MLKQMFCNNCLKVVWLTFNCEYSCQKSISNNVTKIEEVAQQQLMETLRDYKRFLQIHRLYSTLKWCETTVSTSFQRKIHVVHLQGLENYLHHHLMTLLPITCLTITCPYASVNRKSFSKAIRFCTSVYLFIKKQIFW